MVSLNKNSNGQLKRWLKESEQHPILLLFTASWSGSSQLVHNTVNSTVSSSKYNIDVKIVDIEQQADLAAHFGIRQVPTIVIIQKREIVEFFSGMINRKKLSGRLQKLNIG